jgi:DNA-binding response OmpR family regulator
MSSGAIAVRSVVAEAPGPPAFVQIDAIQPASARDLAGRPELRAIPGGAPADQASGAAAVQHLAVFVGQPAGGRSAEGLARGDGFAVLRVADAAAAEAVLRRHRADLIVLDGGPSGQIDFGGCRRLASLDCGPVLVIARADDEIDRVLALELGADDCVSPGCGDRELMARMRVLARRQRRAPSAAEAAHALRFSDFRLDLLKRELSGPDGGRIPLSHSEFELLHLFLRNPGRVVSPDDIRAACKGDQWRNPRNVAVRVYRLRRRLQAESGCDLIRTVHSMGYMLNASVSAA